MNGADTEVDTSGDGGSRELVATPPSLPLSELQMRIAHERPRNLKTVLSKALEELKLVPEFAEDMYYSIPYKNKKKNRVDLVQGLSIKAAMLLARLFGNSANGARIADNRDEIVVCQGMFFDYENNVLTLRDMEVPKWERTYQGPMRRLDANRMKMAVLAGESKAVRNAILHTLPESIKNIFFRTAVSMVVGEKKGVTVAQRIEEAKAYFVKLGATKEEVETLISGWVADSDGKIAADEILANLVGLKNAIRDDQIDIAGAMMREGKQGPAPAQEKPATAEE